MRKKHWQRMWRKEAATREIIKNQHRKAGRVYVDGVLLGRNDKIDLATVKEIKVTGTLYPEVEEFCNCFFRTKEDHVIDLVDLSEAYLPEEDDPHADEDEKGKRVWYLYHYAFARKVVAPANCTEVCNPISCGRFRHTEELVAMPDHPHIKSVDGVIYSKDGLRLLAYPFARKSKDYALLPDTRVIAGGAFMKTEHLEEIVFNDGLEEIETYAISYLPNLHKIGAGATLRRIDYWGIFVCDKLEEIFLPASLQEYIYEAVVCDNLKCINVAEGGEVFRSIDGLLYNRKEKAFVRCPRAYEGERVCVQEGTKRILSEAFKQCKRLRHLHLPKSLESIEPDTFTDSENIECVTIEEGNKHFCIDGGILYNADKTQLVYCPPMLDVEEFVVPDSVVQIEEAAFAFNQKILKLTIPGSVKEVGHRFLDQTNITEMWLPRILYCTK